MVSIATVMVTQRIFNTRLLIIYLFSGLFPYLPTSGLLTSGLLIYLLPVYFLIYLLPVYLLPVKYLLIYLLIYFNLMAYGHTPLFSPTSWEFCPSDNVKTAWSISDCIIMHYTVSSSFKHHPIPDGLIVVSDGVDFVSPPGESP